MLLSRLKSNYVYKIFVHSILEGAINVLTKSSSSYRSYLQHSYLQKCNCIILYLLYLNVFTVFYSNLNLFKIVYTCFDINILSLMSSSVLGSRSLILSQQRSTYCLFRKKVMGVCFEKRDINVNV